MSLLPIMCVLKLLFLKNLNEILLLSSYKNKVVHYSTLYLPSVLLFNSYNLLCMIN